MKHFNLLLFSPGGWLSSHQTQNISVTFIQRRPNVFDVGSTLYKYYTNVLCLLGCLCYVSAHYIIFPIGKDEHIGSDLWSEVINRWYNSRRDQSIRFEYQTNFHANPIPKTTIMQTIYTAIDLHANHNDAKILKRDSC